MFLVFDTQTQKPDADQHGHVKVYATEKAARRAAQRFNNSVSAAPGEKFRRMAVCPVNLQLEIVWGKPNYHAAH